jgi:ADP-ribose pyrophosphatase YjhB (NUDIX family)
VLLVASRYANHEAPIWNLPGGRQVHGELLAETAVREAREETGLLVRIVQLAYVSESYDGNTHFLCAAFAAALESGDAPEPRAPDTGDHVEAVRWTDLDDVASLVTIAVVREPLVAYLAGQLPRAYAGYHDAGVTIRWPSDPPP